MAQIKIQLKGLRQLQKAMKIAPTQVKREVNDGIATSLAHLERTAKTLAPVDTGRLRASHTTEHNKFAMRGEMYPKVKYATYVHEGTKPHFPPYKGNTGVSGWAKRHGANPYLVARGISKYGTQGVPWITATAHEERATIEREIQKSVNRALRRVF